MMLILYGPTVTGKTSLALKLAKKFNGELISADSRQVYKGLDIGSGKVSFESRVEKHDKYWKVDGIKIHGFDLKYPNEQFTVVDFLNSTAKSIEHIKKINKLPIIVGGTGFYINALFGGIDSIGIPKNENLRKNLEKLSKDELFKQLRLLNPKKAMSLNESDRLNPRRLIRAIELVTSNYKSHTTNHHQPISDDLFFIGLTVDNNYLYQKADKWLDLRLKNGLIEEVKSLIENGVHPNWLLSLGLEYRWITKYINGEISKNDAIKRLKGDIHSLIRRQKTWFKKFDGISLFNVSDPTWHIKLEKALKDWYTRIDA